MIMAFEWESKKIAPQRKMKYDAGMKSGNGRGHVHTSSLCAFPLKTQTCERKITYSFNQCVLNVYFQIYMNNRKYPKNNGLSFRRSFVEKKLIEKPSNVRISNTMLSDCDTIPTRTNIQQCWIHIYINININNLTHNVQLCINSSVKFRNWIECRVNILNNLISIK